MNPFHFTLISAILGCVLVGIHGSVMSMFDLSYWRCVLKKTSYCDSDIKFFMYKSETGTRRMRLDVNNFQALDILGWHPERENVIIVHGFNETEGATPLSFIRNAYLARKNYNVFTVDWQYLTVFPCYLSALSNTRLVSRCSAKLYSYLTKHGAKAKKIHCVGHSLGAHICGMMSQHLTKKQWRIVGLDPARPLVDEYGSKAFRLTRDDAYQVQIIHTNAGFLGETGLVGHLDFCINNGKLQPGCKGHSLRRARCSHFQSACYYAKSVGNSNITGVPCTSQCPRPPGRSGLKPGRAIPMGLDAPINAVGMHCVKISSEQDCPFD